MIRHYWILYFEGPIMWVEVIETGKFVERKIKLTPEIERKLNIGKWPL